MKLQTLFGFFFFALLAITPAYAYSQPASTVKARTEATKTIDATLIEPEAGPPNRAVTYQADRTADGMIGKYLRDSGDKKVARVKDIIIGENGTASMLVAKTGSVLGIGGKLKALDYKGVVTPSPFGDQLRVVGLNTVKNAPQFSRAHINTPKFTGMPDGSLSAAKLLSGKLLDSHGLTVGRINNITLNNGIADKVIVSVPSALHPIGAKVAVNYGALRPVRKGSALDLQMSDDLSARFEAFKNGQTASR